MEKRVLFVVAIGSVATISCSCEAKSVENKSPNVIFILADDLGYGDLGCYGQTKFETPNIDAMSEQGMQFTQSYAGCSVSAPSRCVLMTGKHTGNSYIRGNKNVECDDGRGYDMALAADEVTMAEMFKERGYSTACCGKWGLGGPNTEGAPNLQGFDYFYGYLGQMFAHFYYPEFLHENNTLVELNGKEYSHDLIEQKALDYIKENKDNPFFLYLSFTLPHAELRLPDEYMTKYLDKFDETPYDSHGKGYNSQEQPHAAFASMVERLDLSVGRVNELLEELGIDDNTLVIFTSDNGAHCEGGADPDFFNSTAGLRGIKRSLHEGGIRVPMVATWKDKIPVGVKNDAPIAFWDMMPTFAEIIGAETPENIDGISMLPSLMGDEAPKHDYLYWEFHEQGGRQAVRKGDWKLIKQKVTTPEDSYYELYNIAQDPSEKDDLIEVETKIAEELMQIMESSHSESQIFKL